MGEFFYRVCTVCTHRVHNKVNENFIWWPFVARKFKKSDNLH